MLPYPPPGRSEMLPSAVIVLAVALMAAGVVAAVRPPGLPPALATRLSDSARTDRLTDDQGKPWQSVQGFLTVSQGTNGLNPSAQQSLQWTADPQAGEFDGRWLAVDYFRPDEPGGVHTDNYLLDGDRLSLQAVESPSVWLTYSPGLPVLDGDTLGDNGSTDWTGTVTASSDGEHTRSLDASADVTVDATPGQHGCVDSTARLRYQDGSRATSTTTWCSGDAAGWAGQEQDGASLQRADSPATPQATTAQLDTPSAQPGHPTGRSDQALTYRYVSNGTYLLPWFSVQQSTMAGETLVTARSSGRLSGWARYDHGLAKRSNRYLVWRAWPGGVVTALSSVGSITVAASTADLVTAYGPDGSQLWRTETSDIATSIHPSGRSVIVGEASGRVRALDARTGVQRWSEDFGDGAEITAEDGGVAVLADDEITVLDADSGRSLWTRSSSTTQAPVITGDVLVSQEQAGTVLARSLRTGEPRWTRSTDPLADVLGSAEQLIVRGASSMLSLAPDGRIRWRAERTSHVEIDRRWVALSYPDRIELWDPHGRVHSWPIHRGVEMADKMLITGAGVMAWGQRTPDGYQDWEYR